MLPDIVHIFLEDPGPLEKCTWGKARILARTRTRNANETPAEYNQAVRTRERELMRQGGCDEYRDCRMCPKSHEVLADTLREKTGLHWNDHEVKELFEYMGAGPRGTNAELPKACDRGKFLVEYIEHCEKTGTPVGGGARFLDDRFKCSSYEACIDCPDGKDLVVRGLRDLSENGSSGEWGKYLDLDSW